MERKHNVNFFVYIIESPSAKDIYNERSEGDLIKRAVSLNGIPCVSKIVVSEDTFIDALKTGIYKEMRRYQGRRPIIHLSAHGSKDGIQLTDETLFGWRDLKNHFNFINKIFDGSLLLCMSSCRGFSACKMSMDGTNRPYPFWGMVGNNVEPSWSETAVAYATFYHHIARGNLIAPSVEAMKTASGNNGFVFIEAETARDEYLKVIQKQNMGRILANLEQTIESETPGKIDEIKKKELWG